MIEILKASAGSGKTFNLAKKYIFLLLESDDPHAFRHILAVTFTNKATEEMKTRIVKELFVLASAPSVSGYVAEIMATGRYKSEEELAKRAHDVLCNILHDYSSFSISTIDRFFQQTLKSFAREIGQFESYQVELDRNSLLQETVDSMLDSLTEDDSQMLNWLTDNAIAGLEEGGKFKLADTLYEFVKRFKSPDYLSRKEEMDIDEDKVFSEDNLRLLRKRCSALVSSFEKDVREAAGEVIHQFNDAGVDIGESKLKSIVKFAGFWSGMNDVPGSTISGCHVSGQYFAKTKKALESRMSGRLDRPVGVFLSLFEPADRYHLYKTAIELRKQICGFGIARRFNEEFMALTKEKNVLCLDDSNTILKGIIDGTDTPFIYEKTGVRYDHFLLDEFQDTSIVQWDNFRPLIENSMASGAYNLIVGDVKQSIYRWRNSDWKLMHSGVAKSFDPREISTQPLDSNWRSGANIVRLNNNFFRHVVKKISEDICGGDPRLEEIYSDVVQIPAKEGKIPPGMVKFTWAVKDSRSVEDIVYESICEAIGAGMSYSDIAVLVRGHKSGGHVASALIEKGVPVVTDDSLTILGALTVRRVIAMMCSIDNPSDTAASYMARELDLPENLRYNSLADLVEELFRVVKCHDPECFDAEVLYCMSFMDLVRDYTSKKGNGLHAFIAWLGEEEVGRRSISSPSRSNAVRIITVHKSKGLDFRYVIMPFVEDYGFYKSSHSWCCPDLSGTVLDSSGGEGSSLARALYDVNLSSKSENTLFAADYAEEKVMQAIDAVNLVYVAMTRAVAGLHIIGGPLKDGLLGSKPEKFSNFSEIMWWYVTACDRSCYGDERLHVSVSPADNDSSQEPVYAFGTIGDCVTSPNASSGEDAAASEAVSGSAGPASIKLSYESYGINSPEEFLDEDGTIVDVRVRSRLKFSTDAVDFFSEDGQVGFSASRRIRGVVLHGILSQVETADELDAAVGAAVESGQLAAEEAEKARELIATRLEAVRERGWFSSSSTPSLRERGIMDTDGAIYRPDRVVTAPDGSLMVIDFKFGAPRRKYITQIEEYCSLFRRMGYDRVSGSLWYVDSGKIVDCVAADSLF